MTKSNKPNLRNPRSRQTLRPAHIVGTGSYVPERVLSNADLEKMVDTTDEWITTRTGIKERRIAAPEQCTSDMAVEAARRAIKQAGVSEKDIDLIICATCTPDMSPNTGVSRTLMRPTMTASATTVTISG